MTDRAGIVTGGASGIGEAIVLRMLRDGAAVYAVDRDQAALDRLQAACPGLPLVCVAGDVTDPDCAAAVADRCEKEHGKIDFLVNGAGVMHPALPLHDLAVADFDRVQAVNLKGVFVFYRAVVQRMVAAGTKGAIVNIASTSAFRPVPTAGGYVASKHGVAGLTTSAALEVAPNGIRVNAVCPGVTDTPLFRATMAGGPAEGMIAMIPIRRIAHSDEMANAVAWLLSSEAGYVTGVILPVDGGLSLL